MYNIQTNLIEDPLEAYVSSDLVKNTQTEKVHLAGSSPVSIIDKTMFFNDVLFRRTKYPCRFTATDSQSKLGYVQAL